jgi:hypothetical protein
VRLESASFREGEPIPKEHSRDGADSHPALAWSGAPKGVRSFALICDDPDAPRGRWVHWILYDIPPSASGLPEGVSSLPAGTREGLNDWKRTGYGGPCPPIGRHRYFFKLYALDGALGDLGAPTKAKLEAAMKGHVLAEGRLMGTYEKQRL